MYWQDARQSIGFGNKTSKQLYNMNRTSE